MTDFSARASTRGALVFTAPAVPSVPVAGEHAAFPVRRIYCVGRNYVAHVKEMGGNVREPPFFFQKPSDAIVLPRNDVPFPSATQSFQHEIELVIAVGMGGQDIAIPRAVEHVFGYAAGVDLTRRDLQLVARNSGRPWESGKSFDHSAPIGVILRRENANIQAQSAIRLSVNRQTRQQGTLGEMIWSCNEIISHLSALYRLEPGDLIFTGTPAGVGNLAPGDLVEGEIDGVGTVSFGVTK